MRDPRPFYVPVGDEEQVFKAAHRQGLSVLLKGPTGCGKTRFVRYIAWCLRRPANFRRSVRAGAEGLSWTAATPDRCR